MSHVTAKVSRWSLASNAGSATALQVVEACGALSLPELVQSNIAPPVHLEVSATIPSLRGPAKNDARTVVMNVGTAAAGPFYPPA